MSAQMDANEATFRPRLFAALVSAAVLIGILFRTHFLLGQTLVDDEWHSMAYVIGKSLPWLLTHFAIPNGFTSIPLNVYDWMLLHSIGWSELWLRLPSVVLGILVLWLTPYLARPLIGPRPAIILSFLMAASPILVFYSRISRPYSAVACFGFLGVILAARWMQSGRLRDGIGFAACGVLAVYWHPFAGMTIATMALSVLLAGMFNTLRPSTTPLPLTCRQVMAVLVGMSLVGAGLMLPALLDSLQKAMSDVAGQGHIPASSWLRFASLAVGTADPLLGGLLGALVVTGIVHLWRRAPWLAGTLVAQFPLQMLALLLVRPHSCHVGIVLARYSIILVPVVLLFVACGMQAVWEVVAGKLRLSPSIHVVAVSAFVAALVLAGPLPRIYTRPNNFTNHGIFQHRYGPIDWSQSFASEFAPKAFAMVTTIRTDELSAFYGYLRQNPSERPIVEYPLMIGDHFNPYYFYQWYHRHPVILGYAASLQPSAPLPGGGVYGNTYADQILGMLPVPSRLKFHNLIDMTNFIAMRARNVEYIILHKRFEADLSKLAPPPFALPILMQVCRNQLYTVYEDEALAVFSLAPEPTHGPQRERSPSQENPS